MSRLRIGRRVFLQAAGLTALAGRHLAGAGQMVVPTSSGTGLPTFTVPPLACDCHHHIYDAVRFPPPLGTKHPAFPIIRRLIDKGRTWVKLSIGSINTPDGPPAYAYATTLAQAYVQAAPERMVWASNWPHPGETTRPDDAVLIDLLRQWAPSDSIRHRILVEIPAALYGFP